jgi:hypothetical protein
MSKIADFFRSHHIQLALATGASIIVLAYVSKRMLSEPMHSLALAFPPSLAVIGEGFIAKCEESWYGQAWVWVSAILLATMVVIGLHLA